MTPPDGKYLTLAEFKQYGIGTRTDQANPTVYNGAVSGTPDDQILSDVIHRAEAGFDQATGTGYDQQTYSQVASFQTFVDRNGWLHLFARERGPVTAVTAVRTRDLSSGGSWTAQAIVADDMLLPPYETTYPHPESWHVRILTSPAIAPRATGQIVAQWSYTGGYQTIPQSLKNIIARWSWYLYKLREAPVEKVVNMPLGTLTVPLKIPPDIADEVMRWRPQYS